MNGLYQSPVVFEQSGHVYRLHGTTLPGVTSLLGKYLFPLKYTGIDDETLDNAAREGTLIHAECRMADVLGVNSDNPAVTGYINLCKGNALTPIAHEYLVSDESTVASQIDVVFTKGEEIALADIKTTSQLDIPYLRWQLSIYSYLFRRQNPGLRVSRLYGIWINRKTHAAQLVEIPPVDDKLVQDFLDFASMGGDGLFQYGGVSDVTLPVRFNGIELELASRIRQMKAMEDELEKAKQLIIQNMEQMGASAWKGNCVQFIFKRPSTSERFDTNRFKAEHPDLYAEYVTHSATKGSLTVKLI